MQWQRQCPQNWKLCRSSWVVRSGGALDSLGETRQKWEILYGAKHLVCRLTPQSLRHHQHSGRSPFVIFGKGTAISWDCVIQVKGAESEITHGELQ